MLAPLLLLLGAGGYGSATARAADPAACQNPTNTRSGGDGAAIAVGPGEVLLLAGGTFTGPVDALAGGGTLCVAAGAVLDPSALRNPAGAMVVLGSADLPTFDSAAGFDLYVAGTVVVVRAVLKGSGSVEIAADGSVTGGTVQLPTGSIVDNAGTLDSTIQTSAGSTLVNSGDLTARGGLAIDGVLLNTGRITSQGGPVRFNAGATVTNSCVIESLDDVTVTSTNGVTNAGIVRAAGGILRVTGRYDQTPTGVSVTEDLVNDGSVTGFGRYRFSRNTRTDDTFAGDSTAEPIVVQDLTPPAPPAVFDIQTGTVVNVEAGEVPEPNALPGDCAGAGAPVADVTVAKTGPAVATPGERVTYTISVVNQGPDPASGLVVTDTPPAELTAVDAPGATPDPGPPATLRWSVPALAVNAEATFTVTGTAPGFGTLLDQASATTATADPDPGNNDGSSPAQQVSTVIQPGALPNSPPVADNSAFGTTAGSPVSGSIPYQDPDAEQGHQVQRDIPTRGGYAVVSPSGVFTYTPLAGFAGLDQFSVSVCDNGTPVLCGQSRVDVVVAPLAVADAATTTLDAPVRIAVQTNDIGATTAPSVSQQPSSGGPL